MDCLQVLPYYRRLVNRRDVRPALKRLFFPYVLLALMWTTAELCSSSFGSKKDGRPRPFLQLAHAGFRAHELLLGCRGKKESHA